MLLEGLVLAGVFLLGMLVMFLILKNNPQYLVKSIQSDKADLEATLAKVENQVKAVVVPSVSTVVADIKKEVPIVEKDAVTVVTDAKTFAEKVITVIQEEAKKL